MFYHLSTVLDIHIHIIGNFTLYFYHTLFDRFQGNVNPNKHDKKKSTLISLSFSLMQRLEWKRSLYNYGNFIITRTLYLFDKKTLLCRYDQNNTIQKESTFILCLHFVLPKKNHQTWANINKLDSFAFFHILYCLLMEYYHYARTL